jgi:hypothetical protein
MAEEMFCNELMRKCNSLAATRITCLTQDSRRVFRAAAVSAELSG